MDAKIIQNIKSARRVSVPIIAITTPDPAATIKAIAETLSASPALEWDIVDGLSSLNEPGKAARAVIVSEMDPTIANPVELLRLAKKLPEKSVLFVHFAHRWLQEPMTLQAAWNLRDAFKMDHRTLILLSTDSHWPAELAGDLYVLDEPLPDAPALLQMVTDIHKDANLELRDAERIVDAVQGLPAFQASHVVAMSLGKDGCDIPNLWERKRRQIELTPGLKVSRDAGKFADIGGVEVIKGFLGAVMRGQARPNAIVFVDEIEKFLAGSTGGVSDSSGVSQDQLGQLLSYMQDHNAVGCILVGPPGAAKSAVAKAAGNEAGIPTIQLDLGAMKGGIVGQSEQNLRAALKVITSVSNGKSLWIATCNAISDLPPELRRRFTLGTFFFDLPDSEERYAIWKIWRKKYEMRGPVNHAVDFSDDGWTGAEIRQCCDIAWRLGCSLREASEFVVPVSRSASEQLERLRKAAEGRFLSASRPGVYTRETKTPKTNGRRAIKLED